MTLRITPFEPWKYINSREAFDAFVEATKRDEREKCVAACESVMVSLNSSDMSSLDSDWACRLCVKAIQALGHNESRVYASVFDAIANTPEEAEALKKWAADRMAKESK